MYTRKTQFENIFGDLMDYSLNIEITDSMIRFLYKNKSDTIDTRVFPIETYERAVCEAHNQKKLCANSIYIKDKLNCFIEDGTLYLDNDLPFGTQMKELNKLIYFYFIDYKKICYDGELSLIDSISNFGKIITSNALKTQDSKTSRMLINIKLQINKLNPTFLDYVVKQVNDIYSIPEKRLDNIVDLTKPIKKIEKYNMYDQLSILNNNISYLVEASNYISKIEEQGIPGISDEIKKMDELSSTFFKSQLEKEKTELIDSVKENAIAQMEGRPNKTIKELDEEFIKKINNYYTLLKEYFSNNKTAYETIYSNSNQEELIIARIDSIYNYYESVNPYRNTINNYKIRIRELINTKEDCNQLVSDYKNYLNSSLENAELFALTSCVELWKEHKNKIVYGMNPILREIGDITELYNDEIKKLDLNRREMTIIEERKKRKVRTEFESKYQIIIDNINDVSCIKDNSNNDAKYNELKQDLQNLVYEIRKYLKSELRIDSVRSLIKNEMVNYTNDDKDFTMIFDLVVEAYNQLKHMSFYISDKRLAKYNVNEYYNNSKCKYDAILMRIKNYYEMPSDDKAERNKVEYLSNDKRESKMIVNDLNTLIEEIKTISNNINILLDDYAEIKKQKTLF